MPLCVFIFNLPSSCCNAGCIHFYPLKGERALAMALQKLVVSAADVTLFILQDFPRGLLQINFSSPTFDVQKFWFEKMTRGAGGLVIVCLANNVDISMFFASSLVYGVILF